MTTLHQPSRALQSGFSLVELLIAMVIGLVIIGAMFSAYLGSGLSSRNTRAMTQITEDASIALSVMRSAIASTSYIVPTGSDVDGFVNAAGDNGRRVTLRGCSAPFADPDQTMGGLTCGTDATQPDAIAVTYQADAQNSAVNSAGNPLDCIGNEVPDPGSGVRMAYQRFFVSNGALECQGPGSADPQALVDNVIDLRVTYGVGGDPSDPFKRYRVVRYMDAAGIWTEDALGNLFDQVLSVRVCVTVASAADVLDAVTQYVDCEGNLVNPPGGDTDRRMFRSYNTTVVLNNRLEGHL
ncbi:PilW family protein [Ideonella sp.]|uniref:PilW family protein n=1 Tax=Ideonella sp. TaxID=1929293 RepID=UPI0035B16922